MRANATSNRDYGRSFRLLEDSNISRLILGTRPRRGYVEIPYRSLSNSGFKSGHRSYGPLSQEKQYFGFVYEAIGNVISLVDDSSLNGSVKLTDKALVMAENAVELYRRGRIILMSRVEPKGS